MTEHERAPDVAELIERLRNMEGRQRQWDGWELGDGPAPPKIDEGEVAALLHEAAQALRLSHARIAELEARNAKLVEALQHQHDRVRTDALMSGPKFVSYHRGNIAGRTVEDDFTEMCNLLTESSK